MKKTILLLTLSLIFATTPFKGYIKHEGYYNTYRYVYAEGQYLNGLMDGEWVFSDGELNYVAHQRNDNNKYKWNYDISSGTFGDRVAY